MFGNFLKAHELKKKEQQLQLLSRELEIKEQKLNRIEKRGNVNINPFSFDGELTRIPFIITVILLHMVLIIPLMFMVISTDKMINYHSFYDNGSLEILTLITVIFIAIVFQFSIILFYVACGKRFRNINKNPLKCLFMCFFPFSILLLIYLCLKKPVPKN